MKIIRHLLFAIILSLVIFLTSCEVLASALTGRPIEYREVRRTDDPAAPPVRIAAGDLARAEQNPETIHGLYDAGKAAEKAREVIESAK